MGLRWGAVTRVSNAVCAALAALTIVLLHGATAQAQTPTPAQLEAFRNLPPDQQRQVLEAVGGQSGGATRRDPQLTTPQTTAPANPDQSAQPLPAVPPGPPRIAAGTTLLLDVNVMEQPTPPDQATRDLLNTRRDRIRSGNPYRLDEQGRLSLPTFPPLNLSGLTELQAAQRLN